MDPQALQAFIKMAQEDPGMIEKLLPLLKSIGKGVSDFGRNTPNYVGGLPRPVDILGQEEDELRKALEAIASLSQMFRGMNENPSGYGGGRPPTRFIAHEELKRQMTENPFRFIRGIEQAGR